MSRREWKPGDVGVALIGERFIVTSGGKCFWPGEKPGDWSAVSGEPAAEDRPLVVIDPEDAKQVERLCDLLYGGHAGDVTRKVQAALREFADPTPPTPPKPGEPQGLGAVVETEGGRRYVRTPVGDDDPCPWICTRSGDCFGYDEITAVRVLSEGVSPDA